MRLALTGFPAEVFDIVAGLGGRAITKRSLRTLVSDVLDGRVEPNRLTFLDLNWELVSRELARTRERRRSGPHAENILRDVGAVAARMHTERRDRAEQQIKFFQVGSFAAGNRLLDPEQRTVRSRTKRSNTLTSGHRACQGAARPSGPATRSTPPCERRRGV